MPDARVVERAWAGDDFRSRLVRAALAPLAWAFGGVTAARNAAYDVGILRAHPLAVPAVSVGNLTVGGTGKTPIAAWVARRLRERGARPAIVMRGYGADEPLVHRRLNPDVPVVTDPDRVAGSARAAAAGATVAVLDDAFQHRRARRDVDLVLVSADAWREPMRLLPAGPWRESLGGLRRASAAIVTRKAASLDQARAVAARLRDAAPGTPVAIAHLCPDGLHAAAAADQRRPLADLDGRMVLAVAAVGDPGAFRRQLEAAGARCRLAAFPDHHAFSDADVATLAAAAREAELVVCTLKDAVKLAPRWPADAPPLWYFSQHVVIESGEEVLEHLLDGVPSRRPPQARTAGPDRPHSPTHGH